MSGNIIEKWSTLKQEINITTYNLCRINMFLHDIEPDKFDIAHGDTLTEPAHWDDEPFVDHRTKDSKKAEE